jgi:RNA polymerase sigma factor (sigma-70 family)
MSTTMATEDPAAPPNALADPGLRRALEDFVRRRVPAPDVDDVVQTVLCDALAAEGRPGDPAELRRWLMGIARHKVADHHRRSTREEVADLVELPAPPPPIEAREMARWAERQVASTRDAKQTLAWMAREGEGEKLESIAAEEQVPAARVRQRVSRMRRWMKERWLAELAAVAALAVIAVLVARLLRREEAPQIAPMPEPAPTAPPEPSPLDRARALRADALEACGREAWAECLRKLDEAAGLDPDGDRAPEITEARDRARRAIQKELDDAIQQQKEKDSLAPPPPVDAKTATPVKAPFETKPSPKSTTPITTAPPRPKKPRGKEKLSSEVDFPSKGEK